MFIVLKTEKISEGFIKRRKQLKRLCRNEPISYPTENGLHFFVLDIPENLSGAMLTATEEKCGRYVSRIVAPKSLFLPDSGKVKRFKPVYSNGFFVLNTAIDAFEKASLRPEETCITVVDRNARMSGEIHRLLPYASLVRAITSRPERYCGECNRIFDDCGASVTVRTDYQPVRKSEIIICCDGATTDGMKNSAVFSFRRSNHGRLRFFSEEIELSANHKKAVPENIDTAHFAAAVTELCASTEYRLSPFSRTEISCNGCNNATVSECLRCYAQQKQ